MHQQVIAPLLDSVLTGSGADGVYLYRFETEGASAHLTVWAGASPKPGFTAVEGRIAREHFLRESPLILHDAAWSDPRFIAFPELVAMRSR